MTYKYRNLREMLTNLTHVQEALVYKYLENMDEADFNEIPTVLMSSDTKKIIETYGWIMNIHRKITKPGYEVFEKEYTIYCVFPTIFKVVV